MLGLLEGENKKGGPSGEKDKEMIETETHLDQTRQQKGKNRLIEAKCPETLQGREPSWQEKKLWRDDVSFNQECFEGSCVGLTGWWPKTQNIDSEGRARKESWYSGPGGGNRQRG